MTVPSNSSFNQVTAAILGRSATAVPSTVSASPAVSAQPFNALQSAPVAANAMPLTTFGSSVTPSQLQNTSLGFCALPQPTYPVNGGGAQGDLGGGFGGSFGGGQMQGIMSMMGSMMNMMMMTFDFLGQQGYFGSNYTPMGNAGNAGSLPQASGDILPYPYPGSNTGSAGSATPTPTPVPTPTPGTPAPATTAADINISVIESEDKTHNAEVMSVLQGAVAQDDLNVATQQVESTVAVPQNLDQFRQFLDNDYIEPLTVATTGLQNVINSNDPANRVVNMSFGRTALTTMNFAKDALKANPALLTELGLPANADLDSAEVNQTLSNFVMSQLGNSATVQQAMSKYQTTAQQAAAKGIVTMVAAGNDQVILNNLNAQGINIDPAWSMNNLAFSNDVITVGATDDKGTAATNDDTMAVFSSMGSSALHPFVSANGVDVNGKANLDGTSFSTPQVSAAVQKMLEANSKLTFAQVKDILGSTASHQVSNIPVIDPAAALAAAKIA